MAAAGVTGAHRGMRGLNPLYPCSDGKPMAESELQARWIVTIEGNLDAFVDGHSGIFVPRAPAAVAAAVGSLLADPDRAARMGAAARRHAAVAFDLSVTLPSLGFTVHELIDDEPSDPA